MPRVEPQFDQRLIGVWSTDRLRAAGSATHARMLFMPSFSGRYETWHNGLNEVITFRWSPPAPDRLTLSGITYQFRDPPHVRTEPCDWHFEAVPYKLTDGRDAAGADVPVLELRFGPTRVDRYGLMTRNFSGFEQPSF
ncbi:MAG TPA: hypothetical protein VER17_05590 [Tepidisphaeraceae bacterium]|nr:hypothetical protein [Tepidisphaeraceae bacterium]